MSIQRSTITVLLCLLLVAGCATTPINEPHQGKVPSETASPWRVAGKALVSSASGGNTFNLTWQRLAPDRDNLGISGPLGFGHVRLERDGTEVVWRDDGRTRPLHELGLTESSLAAIEMLPLHRTGDWLIGHPQSQVSGWLVDVTDWQVVDGWRVPRKLTMKHHDYVVTIVLLDWQLEALK